MATVSKEALAHLTKEGREHGLREHLEGVAAKAGAFGEKLSAKEWAYLAGLWHDLGKYAGNFQKMIREENGFAAHIEGDTSGPRDHSTAGAIHALDRFQSTALPLMFTIAGHHAGLADVADLLERCKQKRERLTSAVSGGAPQDILQTGTMPTLPSGRSARSEEEKRALELWIRLLFSALCDADFLDTESFYNEEKAELRGQFPSLSELAERLSRFEAARPPGNSLVNQVRDEILADCRAAASLPPGIFSLTVPTGGGKTLSAMAFALEHAKTHGLERVIVTIPYTSIIEQNAEKYREALQLKEQEPALIEHHSAFDMEKETPQSRIACENWDAPVVVTTTVQLLESLFANRPSACRKLHHLARSVIIFDEAQTLPPGLLRPILDVLSTLSAQYNSSIVISTATQPALGRSHYLKEGFSTVREIVSPARDAFARLQRVKVRWPSSLEPVPYEALAEEIAKEPDVLAVVHRRKDARLLCELIDAQQEGRPTIHLSALMCAEHRSAVLADINALRARQEPIRVVSTQLVEAGVNLDFPLVYRALAGLDSLAQAAGRCNREGRLPGLGELRVFVAPTQPPKGALETTLGITRTMLAEDPALDLFAHETFRRFFSRLYQSQNLDHRAIQNAREKLMFKTVAASFSLIEDEWSAPLVVPYPPKNAPVEVVAQFPADKAPAYWIRALEAAGPKRDILRRLQRFTISVPKFQRDEWIKQGFVRSVADTVFVLDGDAFSAAYDWRFGLLMEKVGVANPSYLLA